SAAGGVEALVGMGAEVVALGLEEIGRQPLASVPVEVAQAGREGRGGHAAEGGGRDYLAPAPLGCDDLVPEEGGEEEVGHARIRVEGFLDPAEEDRAYDAAAPPHERYASVVELPAVFRRRRAEEEEALCVGDDLGRVEGVLEGLEEGLSRGYAPGAPGREGLARRDPLVLLRRQAAR